MNIHTFAYQYARNQLFNSRLVVAHLLDRPMCDLSEAQWKMLVDAEQRMEHIPPIIDRLRFLAKHNRSKYDPHVGTKQRDKRDERSVCCLPDAVPATNTEENQDVDAT